MLGKTYIWTYDKAGNIRSRETYAYTTGSLGSAQRTVSYDYSSSSWGDLLTSYWGNSITYDGVGNPLTWGDYGELTWQGRRLMSYSDSESGDDYSYTYNADGVRTSKTVNGVKHTYHLSGTQILSEEWTEDRVQHILIFVYDDSGQPIGMSHFEDGVKNGDYLFAKNVQGDITAVYDANGTCLVTYTYDAWGNTRVRYSNGGASTAARYNPFRYRGYYYDIETGFYYLNSRYYDSAVCRFINADLVDVLTATPRHLSNKNLFAYCDNNPVMRSDGGGKLWNIVIGAVVGGLAGGIVAGITSFINTGEVDWGSVVINAVVGAAGGAIAATGLGALAQAGLTAAASGAGNAVEQIYTNQGFDNFNLVDVAFSAAVGGGTSLLGTGLGKAIGHKIEGTGKALLNQGKDKLLIGYVRQSVGQSHSALIRQGTKLITQANVIINTFQGLSSVVGSGVGVFTSIGANHVKKNVFEW